MPVAVTRITAHPTLYCFAVIAPLPRSGTVQFRPTRGSLMAIPFFTRNKQARLSINTNLACRFPTLAFTNSANRAVINSSVASTIATGDGGPVAGRSLGTRLHSRWGFCSFILGASALATRLPNSIRRCFKHGCAGRILHSGRTDGGPLREYRSDTHRCRVPTRHPGYKAKPSV